MDKSVKYFLKLIFSFTVFFYLSTILLQVLSYLNIDINKCTLKDTVFIEFMLSLSILIIFIIVYRTDIIKYVKQFKKKSSKYIKSISYMFLVMLVLKVLITVITSVLITLFGFNIEDAISNNQNLVESYINNRPILMFIISAFFAPVYEEILFRLGIRRVITNKKLFILISGSIFGLMHVFPLDDTNLILGIIQSLSYVSMGFVLAYSYAKYDNIFVSIGVHMLNNMLSALILINGLNII